MTADFCNLCGGFHRLGSELCTAEAQIAHELRLMNLKQPVSGASAARFVIGMILFWLAAFAVGVLVEIASAVREIATKLHPCP